MFDSSIVCVRLFPMMSIGVLEVFSRFFLHSWCPRPICYIYCITLLCSQRVPAINSMSALPINRPDAYIQMFGTYSTDGGETCLHVHKNAGRSYVRFTHAGKENSILAR